MSKCEGIVYPVVNIGFLILLCAAPAFIFFSSEGPGAMHAPMIISIAAGLIVGALAQKSRFCTVSGIRDTVLFKDTSMLLGFVLVIVVAVIGNMIMGTFNLGFEAQPVAHSDGLWNFLGMILVGFGSVLLGGCPLRQVILAGEGNTDSVVVILGFIVGAAVCHNFGLASSVEGPSEYGPAAVIICLIIVAVIALTNINKTVKE